MSISEALRFTIEELSDADAAQEADGKGYPTGRAMFSIEDMETMAETIETAAITEPQATPEAVYVRESVEVAQTDAEAHNEYIARYRAQQEAKARLVDSQ